MVVILTEPCRQDREDQALIRPQSVLEVRLTLEWPDGRTSELYSPSNVILNHFSLGQSLPVAELTRKGIAALEQASERVRARRYGFACTALMRSASGCCNPPGTTPTMPW